MTMRIEQWEVSRLKPHPLNPTIYGESENISDLELHYSRSHRIDTLIINPKGEVIAGNRRLKLAVKLNIPTLTCEVREYKNEIEELEALLSDNASRHKTRTQKIREGLAWERILSYGASKRSKANLKNSKEQPQDDGGGATRDRVAQLVGLGSGYNYGKGKAVINLYEKLKAEKHPEADALLEALENSIDAAYKLLRDFESRSTANGGRENVYTYQGRTTVGANKNLCVGDDVIIATSVASSDPNKAWVRLKSDYTETFLVDRADLDLKRFETWRDKAEFSICEKPASSTEHLYFRCDDQSVNQQVAWSVHRELLLGRKLEFLNTEFAGADKKRKEDLKRAISLVEGEIHQEQSLQRSLVKASDYDANEVRSLREELRLKAKSLGLPANGDQVLPDMGRNEGEPATLADDRPFATPGLVEPQSFEIGDRVRCFIAPYKLGTVDSREKDGSICVLFDDGTKRLFRPEIFREISKVSPEEEWKFLQQFEVGLSDCPSAEVRVRFVPDVRGGIYNRLELSGDIEDSRYFSKSEISDFLKSGKTPVKVAREVADEVYSRAAIAESVQAPVIGWGEKEESTIVYLSDCQSAADIDRYVDRFDWKRIATEFVVADPSLRDRIAGFYPGIWDILKGRFPIVTVGSKEIDLSDLRKEDDALKELRQIPKDVGDAIRAIGLTPLEIQEWSGDIGIIPAFLCHAKFSLRLTNSKHIGSWIRLIREKYQKGEILEALLILEFTQAIFTSLPANIFFIPKQFGDDSIVYLGKREQFFCKIFSKFGVVLKRYEC